MPRISEKNFLTSFIAHSFLLPSPTNIILKLTSLLEIKWIKPAGRRETPGRPVTWVTDIEFLKHFGLKSIKDLPKVDELESIIL